MLHLIIEALHQNQQALAQAKNAQQLIGLFAFFSGWI